MCCNRFTLCAAVGQRQQDAVTQGQFLRIRLGQGNLVALFDQLAAQSDPALGGPFIVGPGGAMGKHHGFDGPQRVGLQTVNRRTLHLVPQRLCRQGAVTRHRVDALRHCNGPVHHEPHRPLVAARIAAIGVGGAKAARCQPRPPGHQGRLDQALKIDHRVIRLRLQNGGKSRPLLPRSRVKTRLAPTPFGDGKDMVNASHALNQRGKRFFNDPIDLSLWMRLQNIIHHGHGLHHVAKRRQFDH